MSEIGYLGNTMTDGSIGDPPDPEPSEPRIKAKDLREKFDFVVKRRWTDDILSVVGDIVLYIEQLEKEKQENASKSKIQS